MEKYMLIRGIGEGGTSRVYLGADKRTGKKYAVKRYENRTDFMTAREECKTLERLCHPGIPAFVESMEDAAGGCIVMEYVPGMTLKQKIGESGKISEEQAAAWAVEMCGILSYLHRRNPALIFRDLKPANIMITPLSHVKLIDFGAAVSGENGRAYVEIPVGTKGYAAPEQFLRNYVIDIRADIYGFGAVLFHMLTGCHPAQMDENAGHKGWQKLSKKMKYILKRCLHPDRDCRYRFCEEIKRDLQNPDFSGKPHTKFRILRSEIRC